MLVLLSFPKYLTGVMGSATQPSQVTSISMLSACESKNKPFLKELESLMTELILNCSRKKMHLVKERN